jgi:copper oxidase (laccase) domain-containing protein
VSGCTYEDDALFSYRRAQGQPTGRGGVIVCMQERVNS